MWAPDVASAASVDAAVAVVPVATVVADDYVSSVAPGGGLLVIPGPRSLHLYSQCPPTAPTLPLASLPPRIEYRRSLEKVVLRAKTLSPSKLGSLAILVGSWLS